MVVDSFDRIVVIFNPRSTGKAPELAEELRAELRIGCQEWR